MSTTVEVQLATAPTDPSLPAPPDDEEKLWYLGRQHRWLLWFQGLSFTLIAYSIAKFATADLKLLLFCAPMSLYAATMLISLVSSSRGKRISLAGHQARVAAWAPSTLPSVDVFLPSAGEPLELLANTYRYVSQLDWPARLVVWVLDDSARPAVRDLAYAHGFEYRTRPDRGVLKKAGNLRFGYEQSDGDYIAIFDADFVPRPDYLHELLPYFDDSDVGIVQSPQFFDTRTPGMGWLQRSAGATQELFYRWIQPARDRSGAAICVGTCAVYRRAALVRSGGFAQIGHSEDVHTGVNLMKAGFRVQYVPVLVSKGVCPDSLGAFLNQQYRWCTGSMSLLADRTFHDSSFISKRQRLCFWAGFLYYISTAVNAFVAPLPGLAMLWYLPQWVEPMNSIWLCGAVMLWFVVLPLTMRGRWRVDVLRVQHLYSFAHAVAIIHVLTGRTKEWVATGAANKRTTPLAVTISRAMKTYIAVTQLLIWAGLLRGTLTYGLHQFWAMLLFGLLASYVQLPMLFMSTTGEPHVRRPLRRKARNRVIDLREPVIDLTGTDVLAPTSAPSRALSASPAPATVARTLPSPRHEVVQPPVEPTRTSRTSEPHAAPGPRRFRPDIQGLRAIAVLAVVLYHAHLPYLSGGYVGVDVFFVISGFLITGQLLREVERDGRISFAKFYGGRMRRLLPPAALVVILTVVAARLWDSIFHVRSVSMDALFTTFYAMNYRLAALGVDYQNLDGPPSPLQHMWSLAVEEQFYVIWPLLIGLCAVIGRRHRRALLATMLVAGTAVSLYYSVTDTVSNPTYAYFSIHTRAWELAVGALVAMAASRLAQAPGWLAASASWIGVAAVVGSAFWYTDATAFPGTAALLPTLGAAVVIAAGCRVSRGSAEHLLALRPMQGIGKVSYGWYLWHWPMLVIIPLVAGYDLGWGYQVEIVVLALWFAVLTHYLVENPALRSRLRRAFWLGGGLLLSAATVAAAVAVMATLPSMVGTGAAASTVQLARANTANVQQALIGGLSVMQAPSNLRPSVRGAQNDQPASSKDGCHADYTKIDQPACVYGDPEGDHTLVLYGDSHAQQWLPALDTEGKAKGWKIVAWTKAACPIADIKVDNSALGRDFTECYTWRDKTLSRIKMLDPDIVVVSQSDSVPGTQVTNARWGDSTMTTMQKLQAAGLPVAYVLDTPLPPQGSVPDCVARNLDNVGACNIPRKGTSLYAGRQRAMAAALKAGHVNTIDPLEWFCTTQACPAIVGDILVYRDASHMSASYSRWLAPMVEPLLVPRSRS